MPSKRLKISRRQRQILKLRAHRHAGVLGLVHFADFYAVIAGWVTAYIARALTGALNGLDASSANALLAGLHAAPGEMIAHQILFLALIGLILIRELSAGLERANLVMIPLLILMLVGIALYGAMAGDVGARWLFCSRQISAKLPGNYSVRCWARIFSVGVGAAMLMTYGRILTDRLTLQKPPSPLVSPIPLLP